MKKLSLTFLGTPSFVADFLEKLVVDASLPIEIKLVITQPDQPIGRKQIITPSPVKTLAQKYNLPVFDNEFKEVRKELLTGQLTTATSQLIKILSETDIALTFAFGRIIPKELLSLPKYGMWNIHPSLLPLYRNVAPTAYPLIFGDKETGVSIIKLDDQLDHGPVIAQEKISLDENEKRPELEEKVMELSFEMFKKTIFQIAEEGKLPPLKEQNHEKATYTRMFTKQDGFIPLSVIKKCLKNEKLTSKEFPQLMQEYWQKYPPTKKSIDSSRVLFNYFRGMYPWPGIWTTVNIKGQQKRLKITDMRYHGSTCELEKIQLEGKKEVDFETFENAYRIITYNEK